MRHPKAFIGSLASVFFCIGFASAAQDHNSSRSNKTSSVVAPDSGGGAVDMKVKEKANRTKSMTADGSQDSSAPESKAFVLPHVLEKSGTINAASKPCDPNTMDCGGAAGIAIDEGGTAKPPKGKGGKGGIAVNEEGTHNKVSSAGGSQDPSGAPNESMMENKDSTKSKIKMSHGDEAGTLKGGLK